MDFSRHLLIDAYNVIHQWPDLRQAMRRGSVVAREMLGAAVRALHDHERIRVTLVFDGQGSEIEIERPSAQLTFSYLFSPRSLSADDVIERLVGSAADPGNYVIVTRDLAERHTLEALGATVRSPEELRGWVDQVERSILAGLRVKRKEVDAAWRNGPAF
jgi:predicted RNA-binding protein with PIN domain